MGSVGIEDTDCPSIEFTYIRLASQDLDHWLSGEVHGFVSSLCQQGLGSRIGKVSELTTPNLLIKTTPLSLDLIGVL